MPYEERIVVFIDLLGFKESVNKSKSDVSEYDRILATLSELTEFFQEGSSEEMNYIKEKLNIDTQVTQVSDSLVITRKINEEAGVFSTLLDCVLATHILISHGYLCRGSIKIGQMHHKNNILFGDAFIRAYQAESQEKLPIIKFGEEIFELARKYPGSSNIGHEKWVDSFLRKDCKCLMTGIYYLDYFTNYDSAIGPGEGEASIHYQKLREILEQGLQLNKESSAYEKYRWAADQFNLTAANYHLDTL